MKPINTLLITRKKFWNAKDMAAIIQSEIRTMTIVCAKIGGINLAQGVCDTEVPLPVRMGAEEAIEAGISRS